LLLYYLRKSKYTDLYEKFEIAYQPIDREVFENTLPDLMVNSWYAKWDASGLGLLTYEVINNGASATTNTAWDINLILDSDQQLGNGNEIYLYYERTPYLLNPGEYVYRDAGHPAYFSLYRNYQGNVVPSGVYYMGLWVDDLNKVVESNEINNGSYSWGTVTISGMRDVQGNNLQSENGAMPEFDSGSAYNGRRLPPDNLVMRKVEITRTETGLLGMRFLPDDSVSVPAVKGSSSISIPTKCISSATSSIFPAGRKRLMGAGVND
jgi:hypothetical protein